MDKEIRAQRAKTKQLKALAKVWRERKQFMEQIKQTVVFIAVLPFIHLDPGITQYQAFFNALIEMMT